MSRIPRPSTLFFLNCVASILMLHHQYNAFTPHPSRPSDLPSTRRFGSSSKGPNNEAIDALRSINDFHEGSWKGKATSFTITADLASGVVRRKSLDAYTTSVKVGLDVDSNKGTIYSLRETFEWKSNAVSVRTLNLLDSHADVDSVDGSYSLDSTNSANLPPDLIGTDQLIRFCIEHTLAINDNERVRCFILYGLDKALARVVLCEEERVEANTKARAASKAQMSASADQTLEGILAVKSDTDRIADKVLGNIFPSAFSSVSSGTLIPSLPSTSEQLSELKLSRHATSLFELSSGVWLGDAIVRAPKSYEPSRGFNIGGKTSKLSLRKKGFANWSTGVQKLAVQWDWNFGDVVQKKVSTGMPLGIELDQGLSMSISGVVCTDESASGRIPEHQRMVCVDWSSCGSVWFLLNHVSIQAPKHLWLHHPGKQTKPFCTDMTVYQSSFRNEKSTKVKDTLEGLCASSISRAYDSEGQFKQGSSSFFTFRPITEI